MASLNEIAETLAERAGRQYDTPFLEEMKVLVKVWRSRLLRDSLERNRYDRAYFRQYFETPVIEVNISELPGFPDKPVLRTKCTMPDPVRANDIYFDYVGSPDKLSEFRVFTEQHEIVAALNSRYTGDLPKALWLNKYLWIFNYEGPFIGVGSVFDDPAKVNTMECGCSEDSCYDDDKEYPISGDIQQRIIQSILSVELRINTPMEPKTVEVDAPAKA